MFNSAAEYYDKFRPGYPQRIVDTLINECNLKKGSKILEIGAGSGKATAQIAGNGFDILCIEPGVDLAQKGKERFKGDSVKFCIGRFEEIELPDNSFDVVFAAQSFHWVPQPQGYEKCSKILKSNGRLAIVYNMYVLVDCVQDEDLFELSKKYGGFADFVAENKCEERIASIKRNIENSRFFSETRVFRQEWIRKYTSEEYFGFLLTGNKVLQKSKKEKEQICIDIRSLANRNGGVIKRKYLSVLYLAQKSGGHTGPPLREK